MTIIPQGQAKAVHMPNNPVQTVEFWRERIYQALALEKPLHCVIYECHRDLWTKICNQTNAVMSNNVHSGSVLDAGCGYGALYDSLVAVNLNVRYTGVDISPDLIELAKYRYPDTTGQPAAVFHTADLRSLPFGDKQFDWAVAREIENMLLENGQSGDWGVIRDELHRVAKQVMILTYPTVIGQDLKCKIL